MNSNEEIEIIYLSFVNRETELRQKYITPYLNSEEEHYRMDLEAYTALCFGAIEDFIKKMAKVSLKIAKEKWRQNNEINDTLLSLTYFCIYHLEQGRKNNIDENGNELIPFGKLKHKTTQNIIQNREVLDKLIGFSCASYLNYIENNHGGITYEALLKILRPVAISLIDNPDIESAFTLIKEYRGSIVHRIDAQEKITTLPSIQDIVQKVDYCLQFCENVKDQVLAKI